MSLLQPYIDSEYLDKPLTSLIRYVEQVLIITSDGRTLTGVLCGVDQATNVILSEAEERIFTTGEKVQLEALGLYLLRGENIAIIGEVDKEIDEKINWENVTGDSIRETKVFS